MQKPDGDPQSAHTGDRLDSWKAIARYLDRTVRTAHRWEKDEGLPVRRHLHARQSTVYAYTDEIDAWVAARDVSPPKRQQVSNWQWYVAAALGIVAIVALIVELQVDQSNSAQTVMPESVAVVPFRILGEDQDDAPLTYGIAEEVLNRLSTIPEITVIARTSAFAFDEFADPVDVSERLGVSYLVVGSVQRDGDDLRIQARLVDRDGHQVWTRRFDGDGTSLFTLQDEIAQAVAGSVAPHIADRGLMGSAPDPESYRSYLLGREFMRLADYEAAANAFQRAVDISPDYARAMGSFALVRALQTQWIMDRVGVDEARKLIASALAIEDNVAEAHVALGVLEIAAGRIAEGEAPIRRALAIDPGLVEAHLWLISALQRLGRFDEAEQQLRTALGRDPLHPILNERLARIYWLRGNYGQAQERLLRILDLPKPPHQAYARLVEINREFGHLEEALAWAREGAVSSHGFSGIHGLIRSYLSLDMVDEAERWYRNLVEVESGSLPTLGIHSEYLFMRGRLEDAYALKTDYIRRSGLDLADLPFAVQETFGGMQILTGRYADGINALEPWFGADFDLPVRLGGETLPLTFAQFLAYGYQQVGRDEDARRLLDRIRYHIDTLRDNGIGNRPNLYIVESRNMLLRKQPNEALAALSAAVESGWRDYVFERAIPIWKALEGNAQYETIMQSVIDDIGRQRASASNQQDSADFEAIVLANAADQNRGPSDGVD